MKKILSLVILVFALGSCSQDIQFNNEAVFQGVKDNLFWRGSDAKAIYSVSQDKLTISAVTLNENMTLTMPMPDAPIAGNDASTHVTYVFGTSLDKTATYSYFDDVDEYFYETAIGVGDGEIVITEYDGTYVTGTFRFNAKNTDTASEAPETVNMQSGVFYKIPVTQEL